jgi:hypothetical protein
MRPERWLWLGPEKAAASVAEISAILPPAYFSELAAVAPQFPSWLASCITKAAHG